jgi:hypothetical protein
VVVEHEEVEEQSRVLDVPLCTCARCVSPLSVCMCARVVCAPSVCRSASERPFSCGGGGVRVGGKDEDSAQPEWLKWPPVAARDWCWLLAGALSYGCYGKGKDSAPLMNEKTATKRQRATEPEPQGCAIAHQSAGLSQSQTPKRR